MTQAKLIAELPGIGRVRSVELSTGRLNARIVTLGATLASLTMNEGASSTELLVHPSAVEGWLDDHGYFGAVIGRIANRVRDAQFLHDGQKVRLAANEGRHQLHGGPSGFDRRLWDVTAIKSDAVTLHLISADGDQGYPGTVEVDATYRFADAQTLELELLARADQETPVALSHHPYFNLSGKRLPIFDHVLQLPASRIVEVDHDELPTGQLMSVVGGVFDFRSPRRIGQAWELGGVSLRGTAGFDHAYVLDQPATGPHLHCPSSGITLEIQTNQPAIQFYTANHLNFESRRYGGPFLPHTAVCLEPGNYPDAINHPDFPSPWVRPGNTYRWTAQYRLTR